MTLLFVILAWVIGLPLASGVSEKAEKDQNKKAWPDLKIHPAADIFPMLDPKELQELADSIKKNGLQQKLVVTTDGVLVDGRNRYAAMKLAGIPLQGKH